MSLDGTGNGELIPASSEVLPGQKLGFEGAGRL